jgi:hypothetical protein
LPLLRSGGARLTSEALAHQDVFPAALVVIEALNSQTIAVKMVCFAPCSRVFYCWSGDYALGTGLNRECSPLIVVELEATSFSEKVPPGFEV